MGAVWSHALPSHAAPAAESLSLHSLFRLRMRHGMPKVEADLTGHPACASAWSAWGSALVVTDMRESPLSIYDLEDVLLQSTAKVMTSVSVYSLLCQKVNLAGAGHSSAGTPLYVSWLWTGLVG